MKKKITSFLAFVILAAGILLVVFLPGNKKATKRDGTATSADDNQDSIFLKGDGIPTGFTISVKSSMHYGARFEKPNCIEKE